MTVFVGLTLYNNNQSSSIGMVAVNQGFNRQISAIILKLQQYDFTAKYKTGLKNENNDALSWRIYPTLAVVTIPPQTSEEKQEAQRRQSDLQSLVLYLDFGVLPQDKKESERVLQLDRVNYLDEKVAPHYIADIQTQEQAHTS